MKDIYVQYAKYNLWANRRIVEAFASLSEVQMEAPIVSSFPSARLTFLHIWDAEFCWLQRLQGNSPTSFPSKSFVGDSRAVYETVLGTSEDFLHFVEGQNEAFFAQQIKFRTMSYGDGEQKANEMVHHCMNHSTFHRGQLITMGRQLGLVKFSPTDFVFYLREAGK
jgi:uncharacterized damage-inducible protein DinB